MQQLHRQRGIFMLVQDDDGTLRIPDFQGNSMFNTLGNIAVNPRTGLCVPDFAGNRLLHLTGEAITRWDMEDMDDPAGQTGGTGRFLEFKASQWILRDLPQRLEWEYLDASPFNPPTAPLNGAAS
jgi:uncharacterized protein